MNDEATMMPLSVAQVATAVNGKLIIPQGASTYAETVVTSTVSDSRQVRDGSVFVAIAGERVDGHDFVAKAAELGAAVALVQHEVDAPIAQIIVDDTVDALGLLARANIAARRASGQPFTIIGITGSVGKTTTKDLTAALLSTLGPTVAPIGSFNNEIGLPLTALKVSEHTRFLVAEMGASHIGEIARLTTIAPPDIAVVLKVGVAHLGEFGSVERIAQAKSEIVQGLLPGGMAVLNADDEHVAAMAAIAPADVTWFGTLPDHDGRNDMFRGRDIVTDDLDHPSFNMVDANGVVTPVTLGICGAHNVMNALAASTVAHVLGMDAAAISAVLGEQSHISPHRMAVSHVKRNGSAFTLIDDSYNANPDSMKAGLDGLARWSSGGVKPFRVAVLGAMLELGGNEKALHEEVGAYAARLGLDAIVAVGNNTDPHFDELAGAIAAGARQQQDTLQQQAARQEDSARQEDNNLREVNASTNASTPSTNRAENEQEPSQSAGCQDHLASLPAVDRRSGCTALIDWVHDTDHADAAVTELARNHADTVVLLKGSHFSGLSALAERWSADAAKTV